ncbi:MAG: ImmA/IrrE family metallo-endopeptidase [Candidatus Margulisbacteria bacterium]|jgi:Zn-dependent peptidase ImmA (M78 family)|nr:ImmA/IrrE family metallo-endopeptidase [Candidatus Margulisiibacteriota bacterium]
MDAINAKYNFSKKQIKDSAETAYKTLNSDDIFPVPIDEILEIRLGYSIIPIPRLKLDLDIDSFITKNQELYIDEAIYMARNNQRYRFSFAHELGHIFLHDTFFNNITCLNDLISAYKNISPDMLTNIETQANQFASFFLCPYGKIIWAIKNFVIKEFNDFGVQPANDDIEEAALNFQISKIAGYFAVSNHAMTIRMINYFKNKL